MKPPSVQHLSRRYVIHGRVQGVGFRFYVEKHAQTLGLKGYARNMPDGTVEVIAVGTPEQQDELQALLHEGPRLALVHEIDVQDAPEGDYQEFRIRI
jgi:acylphosphatase